MAVAQKAPNQVRDLWGEGSSRVMLTDMHHIRGARGVKVMDCAVTIAIIFLAVVTGARVTGHWDQPIDDESIRYMLH